MAQQDHGALDFVHAPGLDRVAEDGFYVRVVSRGVEFEEGAPGVQRLLPGIQLWRGAVVEARAGQHAGEFLDVLLGVGRSARPAADAQHVQFHQLARVVLVDAVDRALRVVEILEHCGRCDRRHHEIAELADRVRAHRVFVLGERPAHVRLALKHVEVIHPEPRHLLAQLRRRTNVANQLASGRLVHRQIPRLIDRRPRLLLFVLGWERVDALLFCPDAGEALFGGLLTDAQRGDGRPQLRRVPGRPQLGVEKLLASEPLVVGNHGWVDAERHAVEPGQIQPCQRFRFRIREHNNAPRGDRRESE